MSERNILVVAVDGLRASALGAYGNTTYGTPALDKFAADSFLFDACFAPSTELHEIYRAFWQSQHPLRSDKYAAGQATLPMLLAERGYQTTLVTDAVELVSMKTCEDFSECVQIANDCHERANDASRTSLARLVADACDIVASSRSEPQFLWIHARGFYGPWDAPLELQDSLLDEGDPSPVHSVKAPDLLIVDGDDPDTAFRYSVAYAAQVMVLDACWAVLQHAFASKGGGREWLVVLTGVRGYPLGEHRRVGGIDQQLYVEQLHVPWLVRFPDGSGRLARSDRLVSPLDLLPTLLDCVETRSQTQHISRCDGFSVIPLVQSKLHPSRDALLSCDGNGHSRAIRTPGWSLRYIDRATDMELFVRPDDRWEANDVANLCPNIAEGLVVAAEKMAARIQSSEPIAGEPLSEELLKSVS